MGLADPILSLIPDILYLRMNTQIATYVGQNQQGGQSESKFMVVLQRDARSVRMQMRLPTIQVDADARYGFDGGRHAQVLQQF